MEKEILIYGGINSYSSTQFINEMNEAKNKSIVVRIATDGGDPQYGFGMIAKFAEHALSKKVKVDGKAYSAGTYFCCYTDDVEALNVSQFLIHRAAYPDWFEKDITLFNDAIKESLIKTNNDLRAALEAKIDVAEFEKMKRVTLDEIFSLDSRIDILLTASEAEKIKLIKKIVDITPKQKAEIQARMSANYFPPEENLKKDSKINKVMTLAELKTTHPEVYAQAVVEGINQERDRVGSWMPFLSADAELVTKSIKDGNLMSASMMSELNVKMFSAMKLKGIESQNPPGVQTPEPPMGASATEQQKAEEAKNLLSFRNDVRAELGLTLLK